MASAASPAPAVTITQEGPLKAKKQLPAQLGAATFEVKLGRQQARKKQATVRIRVCDLAAEAQAIDKTLRSRLLTLLEEEHPTIAMALFGHTSGLAALTPEFSACEPAVNIYTEGGIFEEHEDGYALSVNVLLSDGTAFTGGGTRFQNENHAGLNAGGLVAGMGILFSGKFSGNVRHSGCKVTSGVRHLYVASFDLT
eukprot:gene17888-24623_t